MRRALPLLLFALAAAPFAVAESLPVAPVVGIVPDGEGAVVEAGAIVLGDPHVVAVPVEPAPDSVSAATGDLLGAAADTVIPAGDAAGLSAFDPVWASLPAEPPRAFAASPAFAPDVASAAPLAAPALASDAMATPAPAATPADTGAAATAASPASLATVGAPIPPAADRAVSAARVAAIAAAILLPLLAAALYHRLGGSALLDADTRRKVFESVRGTPGVGVLAAAREVGVAYSTAAYHLDRLVHAGLVVREGRGRRLRYFENGGALSGDARAFVHIVKNSETARLVATIMETPGAYRALLAEKLGVTHTTVNWHLKRLAGTGLVAESRAGRRAILHVDTERVRAVAGVIAESLAASDPEAAASARRLLAVAAAPAPA